MRTFRRYPPRERGSVIAARIVCPHELSKSEIELWRTFCRNEELLAHPFFSFAFIHAVACVHSRAFVAILEQNNRIVGFFPFQFAGRTGTALRTAERVGGDLSDRFGVIAGAGLFIDVPMLLAAARLSSLSYSFMPIEQARYGLRGQRELCGQHILLSGDASVFWSNFRSANRDFASQIDRKERRFARELGPLSFTFELERPAEEVARLIAVKREQYKRTSRPDALASRWKRGLFGELIRNPQSDCSAVVSTLYAGETWIASHVGLMSEEIFHFWFPVYNTLWAQLSPGHILTKHMILAAFSRGIRKFDLGEFAEYKDRFRPERYGLWAGYWAAPNFGGHVAHALQRASWRLSQLKRLR